ncbi:uncharacterized protein LOC103309446 [Acyrthosiphon pisum]|uniref:Integrase catalytic domain-containing protein n=1 Tax=Acyrthosiphon pisum TaxID=7029 RepID=A0A8R2B5Z7_ACYPI|nr:uncharacterized protein LOC103309446 [Acyrthosiphon pisum]|eukprot:XP_008183125.1 PREDICTED: uncharacterized protein LOC103309446 [Acyrthosiphon pisum]
MVLDGDTIKVLSELRQFRQEELPQINRKFDDVQSEIELLNTEDPLEEEKEREEFEKNYFAACSRIQESRVQLPPVKIPEFSGNIQDWEPFFDSFRSAIHEENSFTSAHKFYYLRSYLTGAALDLIKAVPMTDANYYVAIERLKQRYDNKSLTIQSHIRSLLESPHVENATATELQQLHSHVCTHIAALKALDQPVDKWDAWLITIISMRLDKDTLHGWQLHQRNTQLPRYVDLEEFLADRCVAMETSYQFSSEREGTSTNSVPHQRSRGYKINNNSAKLTLLTNKNDRDNKCTHCSGKHWLFFCDSFKELDVNSRLTVVRDAKLCFNCLSPYHQKDYCKSKYSCHTCKGRHNTLLHQERKSGATRQKEDDPSSSSEEDTSPSNSQKVSMSAQATSEHVFLATAVVTVKDSNGSYHKCRAVLDSGSQVNFISKELSRVLGLKQRTNVLPICGIGTSKTQSGASVDVTISSSVKKFDVEITCHILPVIVNDLSAIPTPRDGWNIPNEFVPFLADPTFCKSGSIDLLIGSALFFDLIGTERIPLVTGKLCLQDSKFGWIVTGVIDATCLVNIGETLERDSDVNDRTDDSAHYDNSKCNQRYLEEDKALHHFQNNTRRNEEGRFIVRLPINISTDMLGNTLIMATTRFLSVERRLQRDDKLRTEYTRFMKEYLEMGHMKQVQNEVELPVLSCYLPHHAVQKESSLTTKIRVVFDASAKSSSGVSLNDILMHGPTVQADVFTILARFRMHQYTLMADIEKMFRQVLIDEKDWNLQRIVWRESPTEPIKTFNLTTVTYGMKPASFLATQCLVTLAHLVHNEYPRASEVIKNDIYMDDLMTGAETEEDCIKLQQELNTILISAKLPLRKWCSNSTKVLQHVGKGEADPLYTLEIRDGDTVKSLGLQWRPYQDEFHFNIAMDSTRSRCTKRTLLSDLNRVFDPLRFLAPVLLKGKIFMQQIWVLKVEWDSPLSADVIERWKTFMQDLETLKNIYIPRKVIPAVCNFIEFHGFCDASEEAYGACIYIRTGGTNETYHAQLMCAKTRVAPLKAMTIPRLELNGALLLAELAKKVADAWGNYTHSFQLWTDSTVVLGWLNSHSRRLKTYVANRVNQILEITEARQWRHVRTNENPADIASRGVKPAELLRNTFWWNGPEWLTQDAEKWRISALPDEEETLPEIKPVQLALISIDASRDLVSRYSDWRRLVRAIAWLRRFVEYLLLKRKASWSQHLTVQELQEAKEVLIKRAQAEAFGKEVVALKNGKEIPHKSRLRSLCPYIDNGLILVGGRLQNAIVSKEQKNPIVLPPDHLITRLIYKDCHHRMLHCGPQALLAEVRRTYWPTRGRSIARSVVRQCVICKRARPTFDQPIMGSLPKQRVQHSRPFTTTGVDFAGPLIIKSGIRGKPGKKAWIAIFVCFSTRAVHIEVVEDLTANAFIAAFRRFISRRGKPSMVWSDNGTNFIGAQKELAVYVTKVDGCLASEGITWKFNPPAAPHFGGIWESAVKSAKFHLTRVVRGISLTLSELQTLLCQIEVCLNCRPLTLMSSDPNDLEPITPAHFLIGGPLMFHPKPVIEGREITALKRWKLVQGLLQSFWNRWYAEYVPQLQIRQKWTSGLSPLSVNDVVIVKEENLPPTRWKLARVVKVHPGKDNVVRVATVKLANGSDLTRPIVKLCRLPIEQTDSVEKVNFTREEDVAAATIRQ